MIRGLFYAGLTAAIGALAFPALAAPPQSIASSGTQAARPMAPRVALPTDSLEALNGHEARAQKPRTQIKVRLGRPNSPHPFREQVAQSEARA